jgi:anti-sigma B factor antagonist
MGNLRIVVEDESPVTRVALEGELDLSEADRLEHELLKLERSAPPTLLIDLRDLTFIDSTGIRLVLEADARARHDARRLALVRGPDEVHRVFLIALLDKRLEFVDEPPETEG